MDGTISRRTFLRAGAAGVAGLAAAPHARPAAAQSGGPAGPPFLHGVASGDPLPDRVILWTRVTPSPEARPGSGLGDPVEVQWEIARDPDFAHVVGSGTVTTDAARDHTVKVDATGLVPGADHWYRFRALSATSPVGRTRTAPAPNATLQRLRLGIVTCAQWEFGYFAAYRHLAERDDLDAVLHQGDYIYEFGNSFGPLASPGASINRVHEPPHDTVTLTDYRIRHGQYRSDGDLQALHAAHPVIVMYDDHEVANDWWPDGAENHDSATQGPWPERLAAGLQAWWEWLPVRPPSSDDSLRAWRELRFGDLVDMWVLDTRRHRDEQPDNALYGYGSVDPAVDDPDRTILGGDQRDWLLGGLTASTAAWKVVANQVPFHPFVFGTTLPESLLDALGPATENVVPLPSPLTVEDWNGYRADQQRVLKIMEQVADVVVLTGDYHESFAADVPIRPGDYRTDGNSVGVEFIVPSVTTPGLSETLGLSGVPGTELVDTVFKANLATGNPWVRYHEGFSNGFGVVEFSPERTHYDYWFLADRTDPASGATVAASWQSQRGEDRLSEAAGPLGAIERPASPAIDVVEPDPDPLPAPLPETGSRVGAAAAIAATAAAATLAARRGPDEDEAATGSS